MGDPERILSQEEVDALLSAIDRGQVAGPPAPRAVLYDFRRPDRLRRGDLEAAEALHAAFARELREELSTRLRADAEVRLVRLEASTFAQAMAAVPESWSLVGAGPGSIDRFLALSPTLAFPVIERLLGGRPGPAPDRSLRETEWRLLAGWIDRVVALLDRHWETAGASRAAWRRPDPALARAFPDGEPFVVFTFDARTDGLAGTLIVAAPAARIERLLERRGTRALRVGAPGVPEAGLDVAARWPAGTMTLGQLRALAPGDLLVTRVPSDSPLTLDIAGKPRFDGRPGLHGERAAVEILGPAAPASSGALSVRPGGRPSAGAPAASAMALDLRAVIARRPIRLEDLSALKPGTVLPMGRSVTEPLMLEAGPVALGEGFAARVGDRFAVLLDRVRRQAV